MPSTYYDCLTPIGKLIQDTRTAAREALERGETDHPMFQGECGKALLEDTKRAGKASKELEDYIFGGPRPAWLPE